MRPQRELSIGSALYDRPVFPAAADPARDDEQHAAWCACNGCTTRQVELLASPLCPGELPTRKDRAQ